MEDKLFTNLYELTDLIKKSSEYIKLKELEKIMMDDKEFIILSNEFKNIESKYNDNVRYNLDNTKTTKELSLTKEKLYNLDVVKNYNNQYKLVKTMLEEISKSLLDGVLNK